MGRNICCFLSAGEAFFTTLLCCFFFSVVLLAFASHPTGKGHFVYVAPSAWCSGPGYVSEIFCKRCGCLPECQTLQEWPSYLKLFLIIHYGFFCLGTYSYPFLTFVVHIFIWCTLGYAGKFMICLIN